MTEKCVCMLYKTKYALRVEAFFTSIQKQAAVDTHAVWFRFERSLRPATACWSQPRALQSHRQAFPTHLPMATSWESAKNHSSWKIIQEWSLWFCGCRALTCSQPVLDALFCGCHSTKLGEHRINEQCAFQSNFKYHYLKCCWAAAPTRSFLGIPAIGLLQFVVPWKQDCCLQTPSFTNSTCERWISPLRSACL